MDYTTVDLLSVQFTATLQPTTGQTWATCEIWRYSTLISILNHRGLFSNQVTLRFKLRPEPFFRVHWEHWHPKVPPSSLELPEQESALEAMETLYAKFANTLVCTAIFWSAGRTTFIDDVDVGFKTESAKAAWMRVILWESSVVLGDTASRDDLHGINQLNTCVADHPNNWRIDWLVHWLIDWLDLHLTQTNLRFGHCCENGFTPDDHLWSMLNAEFDGNSFQAA